jgi:DNA-binding transcriptional MocR family regulator
MFKVLRRRRRTPWRCRCSGQSAGHPPRPQSPSHLWLRVHCNFDTDEAIFSWSADGKQFTPLGNPFTMTSS